MAAAEPLGRYEPFGERLRQFPLDSALAQRDTLAPLDTCASVLAPPCGTPAARGRPHAAGMRHWLLLSASALAACTTATAPPAAPGPAQVSVGDALAPVFQADLPQALQRLRALQPEHLNPKDAEARSCVLARFAPGGAARAPLPSGLPAPLASVLAAYRRYWTEVLMQQAPATLAEATLSQALAAVPGVSGKDLDAQSEAVVGLAEREGWHALGGVTSPLRELMLWREQRDTAERVVLPGGAIDVQVHLLDGFASFGWGGWATCGRSHTGGWTTADGLMVVAPAWDLASENYRVSLLAHEAQHFSDLRRYPQLAQTDLEYRAKLVELALAQATQRTLMQRFAAGARRDRSLPHPFADYWVTERMGLRLGDTSAAQVSAVREAAIALLVEHGAALEAQGAAQVRTALPD